MDFDNSLKNATTTCSDHSLQAIYNIQPSTYWQLSQSSKGLDAFFHLYETT